MFIENEAYQNHPAQAFYFVGGDKGMGWEGAPPHPAGDGVGGSPPPPAGDGVGGSPPTPRRGWGGREPPHPAGDGVGGSPHPPARTRSQRATADGDRNSLNLPRLPRPTGPSAFPQSPLDPVTCLPPPPQGGVGPGMWKVKLGWGSLRKMTPSAIRGLGAGDRG